MLNQVTLVGRLTKDLEVRYTPDGKAVSNVALAVSRNFRDQNGEYKTDFVQCTLWGKVAEKTALYCGKGSVVGVTGRIATRKYENAELRTVYVTEVVAENVQFMDKLHKSETDAIQSVDQLIKSETSKDTITELPRLEIDKIANKLGDFKKNTDRKQTDVTT